MAFSHISQSPGHSLRPNPYGLKEHPVQVDANLITALQVHFFSRQSERPHTISTRIAVEHNLFYGWALYPKALKRGTVMLHQDIRRNL